MKNTKTWKICSRGHKYQGSDPCPVCWPGHYKREKRFVAFLRGINVGGNSVIKMADLKKAAEKCGFKNVRTFIQSGNIIFESEDSIKNIAKKIETEFSKTFGFAIRVIVKTNEGLEMILRQAPREWKENNDLRCYLAFVRAPKTASDVMKEVEPREGVDSVKIGNGVLYMASKLSGITKSGFSKLARKKIYQDITIRNYRTVQKISMLMGNVKNNYESR